MRSVKGFLRYVPAYIALQKAIGADRLRYRCLAELELEPDDTVLDVGCGPAYYLDRIRQPVAYYGFDTDPGYIEWARRRWGARGTFRHGSFDAHAAAELPPVQAVLLLGLLHHLSDTECRSVLDLCARVSTPEVRVVSVDTCFAPSQGRLDRWMAQNDRGNHVREPAGFVDLGRHAFASVDGEILSPKRTLGTYWLMRMGEPRPFVDGGELTSLPGRARVRVTTSTVGAPSSGLGVTPTGPSDGGAYIRAAIPLVYTAVIAGLVVSLAPALPTVLRPMVVTAGLLGWIGGAALSTVRVAGAIRRQRQRWRDWTAIAGGAAILGGVLLATLGGLVQLIHPHITWNNDARYNLSLAQTIARFGGLDRALDYLGGDAHYHAGPAWLAGEAERLTGVGIQAILFVVVPALCALTVGAAILGLMRLFRVGAPMALAATGAIMTVPYLESGPTRFLDNVRNIVAGDVFFLIRLQPNSFFALAVGLAALVLLAWKRRREEVILGVLGLGAIAALKPPYFVSFAAVLVVLAIVQRAKRVALRWSAAQTAAIALLAGCVGLVLLRMQSYDNVVGGVELRPFDTGLGWWRLNAAALWLISAALVGHCVSAVDRTGRRATAATVGSAATLGVFVALGFGSTTLPIYVSGLTGCVAAAALLVMQRPMDQAVVPVLVCGLAAAALFLALNVVHLRLPDALDAHVQRNGLTQTGLDFVQGGFAQSADLMWLLGGAFAFAVIFASMRQLARHLPALVAAVTVATALLFAARMVRSPMQGYEAADSSDVASVLSSIPVEDAVLVSSDLADPAEDYSRGLRAFYLAAQHGHQFVLANVVYWNFRQPGVEGRLPDLRAFFDAPWSDWHDAWLAGQGVTHVLISDRCPPTWSPADGKLELIATQGHWSVYRVLDRTIANRSPRPRPIREPKPRFGRAGCLSPV